MKSIELEKVFPTIRGDIFAFMILYTSISFKARKSKTEENELALTISEFLGSNGRGESEG